MKHLLFACSILIVLLGSCKNSNSEHKKEDKPVVENSSGQGAPGSIVQLDERLNSLDSLVFVFYKDPHGKDSLRYTRYYTQFHSTNTALVDMVKNSLQSTVQRPEKVKPCRSEGKIWCFENGNIIQTIYFSSHSQACNFVYIIKNGQFFYSDISKVLTAKLAELKPLALESSNKGE